MREEKLLRVIGDVDDDLVEEAAAQRGQSPARPALKLVARWGAVAACLALVIGLGLTRLGTAPQLLPGAPAPEAITPRGEITPFSAPMGVRKFLNYGGYRYAFLEDGSVYDLDGLALTAFLGTLEHDIAAGMNGPGDNEAATMDLAATFALGGALYELPGYDPAYRVAVVWEGETYLAELVGRVDNQPLDAGEYVVLSRLEARVRGVDILPHMGGEALSGTGRSAAKALVRLLADARPAAMTGEDYLAVADAQRSGRSWQLRLRLDDGTSLTVYLILDLGLVSIGDSTYTLPDDFEARWGGNLDGLAQDEHQPMY